MSNKLIAVFAAGCLSLSAVANADAVGKSHNHRDHSDKHERDCAPRVEGLIKKAPYETLYYTITSNGNIETLTNLVSMLETTQQDSAYEVLLTLAFQLVNQVAGSTVVTIATPTDTTTSATPVVTPRVIIFESDGTVIVDTASWKATGEDNTPPFVTNNTLANWQKNVIDIEYYSISDPASAQPAIYPHTPIAVLDAQLWPCGKGVETRWDGVSQSVQNFVAVRLGCYLNNSGTVVIAANETVD